MSKMAAQQGEQLAEMVRWYSPAEVLKMATSGNAELLALSGLRRLDPGKLGIVAEGALADLAVVALPLLLLGKSWIATALGQPAMLIALLLLICGVILAAAVAIVRHAEVLAHRLGEPAVTVVLDALSVLAGGGNSSNTSFRG